MGLFTRFRKRSKDEPQGGGSGFYPLYESQRDYLPDDDMRPTPGETAHPDYSSWDRRMSGIDDAITHEERRKIPWWKPAHYRGKRKRWWAVRIFAAAILLFFALVAWLAITAPLSKSLEPIAAPQVTLLASDGTPIARSGAVVAEPVVVADLPPHVIDAFLAIEDRRFYSHWGVDPRGIARAAWTGYGGGSTITQQLAKFTFLTPEQTITRKAREALIALDRKSVV